MVWFLLTSRVLQSNESARTSSLMTDGEPKDSKQMADDDAKKEGVLALQVFMCPKVNVKIAEHAILYFSKYFFPVVRYISVQYNLESSF